MLQRILCIAINTYRESIRSKILYSLIFFTFILLCLSAFFGTVTIGDQIKVIKDFGLFSISIFSVCYVVISGASLLHKELAKKTVYNILAKPVERSEFLVGKYLGLFLTALLTLLLMGACVSFFLIIFDKKVDPILFIAYYFMALELLIICATSILFSAMVVTPSLIGLFTISVFLAGRSTEILLNFFHSVENTSPLSHLLKVVYWLLPHLSQLAISDRVVFSVPVSISEIIWGTIYSLFYSMTTIILATLIFEKREFN